LQTAPADTFDAAVHAWVAAKAATVPRLAQALRMRALDGKTARGSKTGGKRPVHLLSAFEHATGLILAQEQVDAKTNEITHAIPLLEQVEDLTDTLITADAMQTQRDFCRYVHRRGAYYLLPAADNQPRLLAALNALAWDNAPLADITHTRGHGRDEVRTLQLLPLSDD
jgi:predicted transposase YbfD/YdcC